MSAGPTLRRATPADVPGIRVCVEAAYRHYIPRMGKPPGPMLDDYEEVVRRHTVFVVDDGAIQGVLVLIVSASGMLLDNIAVHPQQQGRGIGAMLMTRAEAEARRLGHDALDLYTHECMVENVAIYRSMGYEETDRREEHGYQRVYMRKRLGSSPD